MKKPRQTSVETYSSEEIAKRVAQARRDGWTSLDLSFCEVQDSDLRSLLSEPNVERLQILYIHHNPISVLPSQIGKLTRLTTLNLSANRISALPPGIGQLTELTSLYLYNNQISTLPPEIEKLNKLTALNLGGNGISALPPEIIQLIELTFLDLAENRLSALPPEIGKLTKLTKLDLAENRISALPPEIGKLTRLTKLDLTENRISALPPEVGKLTELTELYLAANLISALPPEIGKLTELTELDLAGNLISALPPEIGKLTKLADLNVAGNQISALPPQIEELGELDVLDVRNNQITSLPPQLENLRALRLLLLDKNPFPDALLEAAKQGVPAVVAYLRGLAQNPSNAVYEAKLLLVGEGGVGKSCLLAALRGEDFVEGRPTTHGIDIKPVMLPHPRANVEIQLNAWDFGGQEVYRVTHQFFFSRHALYLVLWNARLGAQQCDLETWLRRIKLRVGDDARIIVVATYSDTDQRLPRVDQEELRIKFAPCIAGFCEVDSATGLGIDSLKKMISGVAAELPQMGEPYPATWKAAQDELLDRAIGRDGRSGLTHVPFSHFSEICLRHGVEAQAQSVLATLLDRRGRIMYYGDEERLADVIILRPDWLTRAISYMLEDPHTNDENGVLHHDRLQAIWFDHGEPQRDQYQPNLYPLFVRLMERFDICYRMDGAQADLVAQLVGVMKPEGIPWAADEPAAAGVTPLKLVCRMDEDPPGLVPWMIVRTHRYNQRRLHWQRGVFLEHPQHGTALIEFFDRELTIQVRAGYPAYFMDVLSETLVCLIDERWPGLKDRYTLTVPCPGTSRRGGGPCKERFPIDILRESRASGDTTAKCNECNTKHSIDTLLLGFSPSPRLASLEAKLDGVHVLLVDLLKREPVTSSEMAEQFRQLRRFMLEGKGHCPGLFTLLPETLSKWNPANWMKEGYRITLWCEHRDGPHPCCPIGSGESGDYVFPQADGHLRAIAPYASVVARLLTITAGAAAPGAGLLLEPAVAAAIRPHLDMMNAVAKTLLTGDFDAPNEPGARLAPGLERSVDGADLRVLESLLTKLDPSKRWGGLRPADTESNEILWLCPEHYRLYVPDLPVIPAQ